MRTVLIQKPNDQSNLGQDFDLDTLEWVQRTIIQYTTSANRGPCDDGSLALPCHSQTAGALNFLAGGVCGTNLLALD